MKLKTKSLRIATLLGLCVLLNGCYSIYLAPVDLGKPYSFYLNKNVDITSIGRITLVELEDVPNDPSLATYATDSLFLAIQKKQVFGVDIVPKSDPKWKILKIEQNQTYTIDQLSVMHKTIRNNAILVGNITQFEPYPHLIIGIKLKIIDLRTSDLVWAFDQVWDSNDQTTKQKIRRYLEKHHGTNINSMNELLVAKSSRQFVDFICHEIAGTLESNY